MSKTQIRIDDMSKIAAAIDEYIGKKANMIHKDRTVLFAEIIGLEGGELVIMNMRRQKQKIALNSLTEIIFDQ